MMFLTSITSALLLAPVALARPRAMQDKPLTGNSRVTAFTRTAEGKSSIECWELSGISESAKSQRADGSDATAHVFSLTSDNQLEGVDIFTFSPMANIWPPSKGGAVTAGDDSVLTLSNTYNLLDMQGGLVRLDFTKPTSGATAADDDDIETHIFSLENGDDWFYFEDQSSPSMASKAKNADPYPFQISSVSGGLTEVMRLRYNARPKHTVLHKGACNFAGIDTPDEQKSSQGIDGHAGLTVQVNVGDL